MPVHRDQVMAETVPVSHSDEDREERDPDSEPGLLDEQVSQLPDPYLNPLEEIVLVSFVRKPLDHVPSFE